MNTVTVIVSAVTAFTIAAAGSLGLIVLGGPPSKWQIVGVIAFGLVVAAKDTRSLLKLPPVDPNNKPD